MARYQDQVFDEYKRPVEGAEVYVFTPPGELVDLTNDVGVALANPVRTDVDGIFYFNAADGQYELEVRFSGQLEYREVILLGNVSSGPPGPAGDVAKAATRAELAATANPVAGMTRYLVEAGREGMFVFTAGNLSALVTADPRQGVYVAPTSGPTGAAGAWVRQYDTALEVNWFGAVADNATDDAPAINGTFRVAEALAVPGYINPTIYRGAPSVHIAKGRYYCGAPLEPLATLRIYGDGGLGWGAPTQLRFPAGIEGLRAQAYNTSGATTVDGVVHFSGDALVVQDINFIGGFAGGAEAEVHGCRPKRAIHLERCTFDGFEGDGLYCKTSFGGGGTTEGNTNVLRAINCAFLNCRNGVYLEGADANAIYFDGCNYSYNRAWGLCDRSFLGNQHVGGHYDANARNAWNTGAAGRPCSYVSQGGNWYFAIDGQEAWCSSHAPSGTTADNQGWGYWSAGGPGPSIPAWFNGIAVRSGGPILIGGPNNASTVVAPHVEINGISQFEQYATVIGASTAGAVAVGSGTLQRNRLRRIRAANQGLVVDGVLVANGGLNGDAPFNILGPMDGATLQDGVTVLATRSTSHTVEARAYDEIGNPGAAYAYFGFFTGLGTILNTGSGRIHRLRIDNADIVQITNSGMELAAGKNLYNNSLQVVGARQAAIANHATDATVNAILAALRAHGLIAP